MSSQKRNRAQYKLGKERNKISYQEKVTAMTQFFGLSRKEARAELEDMGEN